MVLDFKTIVRKFINEGGGSKFGYSFISLYDLLAPLFKAAVDNMDLEEDLPEIRFTHFGAFKPLYGRVLYMMRKNAVLLKYDKITLDEYKKKMAILVKFAKEYKPTERHIRVRRMKLDKELTHYEQIIKANKYVEYNPEQ